MNLKIFGAVLIILGCSFFGFMYAAVYRKETQYLRNYISALEFMECELQYRLTPLPELCQITAGVCNGSLKKLFITLAEELQLQNLPNAEQCMLSAIEKVRDLPDYIKQILQDLGTILGRFDLNGQCKGLESLRMDAMRILKTKTENQDIRLRSYQTLGICAGAAVVILFI